LPAHALAPAREPFSHPDWLFELKWDGFRSLAYIEDGQCKLVSRNGNVFKSFPALSGNLPTGLHGTSAVLDGEIVCLDRHGKPQFRDLLFRRGEPCFYAFDLLWCDGEDLRYLPLMDRKLRLRAVVPTSSHGHRLLYCDHVEGDGERLFQLACERDLEGVVAKWKLAPYLPDKPTSWLKIRNHNYSQWVGREELFERERHTEPDLRGWDTCVKACAAAAGEGEL
jgi:bifunctional non-homologous end joining protein LigD